MERIKDCTTESQQVATFAAMHPKDLSILDFTYTLPDERIAKHPLADRDQSKLLVYRDGKISESIYANLPDVLPADTLLIFNNTKVVEARLLFHKSTGGTIEIFCLEPADQYPDITTAMLQKKEVLWKCLVGGAKKWKEEYLYKETPAGLLKARKVEKTNDSFIIAFSWEADLSFAEVLHLTGLIPLPPYLNREAEAKDQETYQTIYAKHDGSVAAPTAGLHFTEALFQKLEQKGIQKTFVTLHVGAGTFKPVKAAVMQEHEMHAEFIEVSINTIEQLLQAASKTIVVVGTTSLRTIESLYWMGVKLLTSTNDPLTIHQWDPYELPSHFTATEALTALLQHMQQQRMQTLITKTQIIIAPGYRLRIAQGIVTNFHQPQSTLLLLVAAITGNHWKDIYQYALDHNFRFLSYGDGSLLWNRVTT